MPLGAYGLGLWKGICKGYEVFQKNVTMLVGRGDRVQFWKDVWVGETPLEAIFPTMYQLAGLKEGTILQHYALNGKEISWRLHLRRSLFDRETAEAAELMF